MRIKIRFPIEMKSLAFQSKLSIYRALGINFKVSKSIKILNLIRNILCKWSLYLARTSFGHWVL